MNSELGAMRIRMHTKKRQQQEDEFKALKSKIEQETQQKLKFLHNQFQSTEKTDDATSSSAESVAAGSNLQKEKKTFQSDSEDIGVGLVTLQEITERRKQKQEEEKTKKIHEQQKKKQKKAQESTKMKRLLSISEEEETESPFSKRRKTEKEADPTTKIGQEEANTEKIEDSTEKKEIQQEKPQDEAEMPIFRGSFGKNDSVETSFLPDRKKEIEKKQLVKELEKSFLEKQEQMKKEKIFIVYSIFDAKIGMGHRASITCEKGTSVEQFLASVLEQWANDPAMAKKSKQLAFTAKKIEPSDLIWVKEDCIIPHHYTFYDLIVTEARGKSGPLSKFDVADDIRLVNDSSKETESTHASKIMEKAWYEKNKHLFPFNRFEYYDPSKDYGKYSIK